VGAVDERTHVNRFIDMHDLGDALLRAGLAEPVLDVERFTLTYPEVRDLMRDLKAIGAHNANAGRPRGLTGKRYHTLFIINIYQ
jgi:malonyl-CoA O-methyltransferase